MNKKPLSQKRLLWLVETSLLCAVVIVMAFTPLGYLKTAGLEITFIMIPVVVGAVTAGPAAGAILGAVFGITSFSQCFGTSAFGAALLSINPIFTFLVCIPTRILAGWLTGVIFKAIKGKKERTKLGTTVACLCGALFNTLFFTGTLIVLFGSTDFIQGIMTQLGATNPLIFAALFVGIQGLVEAGVCFAAGSAVSLALQRALKARR